MQDGISPRKTRRSEPTMAKKSSKVKVKQFYLPRWIMDFINETSFELLLKNLCPFIDHLPMIGI
jgi:hypothetical protein